MSENKKFLNNKRNIPAEYEVLSDKTHQSIKTKKSTSRTENRITNSTSNFKPNIDTIFKQAIVQKPFLKAFCSVCSKDLNSSIRIIGKSLKEYCIECLINLNVNENYHIVDKMNFSIFNKEWTLKEELQLLSCIEKYGLDNWNEISNGIKSKPKIPCESHYYTYFLRNVEHPLPSQEDVIICNSRTSDFSYNDSRNLDNQKREDELREIVINKQGLIPENLLNKDNKNNNRSRSIVKNRNRKDQKNVTTADEIIGYWPKREEFDVEFLNEAEIEIAELEFLEEDTPEDRELKLNVLQIYNMHLAEREARKK